jgi:hypothetical protein
MSGRALPLRVVVAGVGAFAAIAFLAATARAGTLNLYACSYYLNTGFAFQASSTAQHMNTANECLVSSGSGYRSWEINAPSSVLDGYGAQWSTVTPSPAILITGVSTPVNQILVDCALNTDGYKAVFEWGSNGTNYGSQSTFPNPSCASGGIGYGSGINRGIQPSRYLFWRVYCAKTPSCPQASNPQSGLVGVRGIHMTAEENTGPTITTVGPASLWDVPGRWVRSSGWNLSFQGNDASGVCGEVAIVGEQWIPGPSYSPNQSVWQQCPGPVTEPITINTANYPDGSTSVTLAARNAAGVVSSPRETVYVDNTPVGLTLSGATDAPSTAGTQYVTATATGGPSGIAGIACSTDGSPYQWHPGASTQIPVDGLGYHQVACHAQNNAIDSAGFPATSSTQTWALTIRQPTVFGIGFARLVDALRCHRVRETIEVPVRWVTVRRHGKAVRIRKRAHARVVRVTRCRARTAQRRVTVWTTVHRHGKTVQVKHSRFVRVVVPPHVVSYAERRLTFGQGAIVSGWLGTSDGTALAGEPVRVLAAADNGEGRFAQAAVATTSADGSWSARLTPGPSRLVEAAYDGSATTEPAISGQVRLIVPARVLLSIQPTQSHWGNTIHISGRVLGGYIPKGKLLRLRIGADGIQGTVGIPDVGRSGKFHTTWTFASGNGTVRYWFSVSTLPEADYPFASASSRRVYVTVSAA